MVASATDQDLCPSALAGKNSNARKKAKNASNVMPMMRKGSEISHTSGHKNNASNARGQQNMNSNNHAMKVSIMTPTVV